MIPQEKSAAVTLALREAFDTTDIEDIQLLKQGHSANMYRIVVRRSPFLLRVITRNTVLGAGRQFTCMNAAAEAGLAPRVWYANTEDQICITDFVEEVPFPLSDTLVRLPRVLRSLHALPAFPKGVDHLDTSCMFLLHKGPAVEGFLQTIQKSNILSKDDLKEFFDQHAQLTSVYQPEAADMVSSHNDLKPENILFDGSSVWLIDWEAAFLNDRYTDLAYGANFVVTNDGEEETYLREYFGHEPDEYQVARFFLVRQIAHMFAAMAYQLMGSPVESNETPDFDDFHRRLWTRELDVRDKSVKTMYGRVHWKRFLENTRKPRFEESLRLLSARPVA